MSNYVVNQRLETYGPWVAKCIAFASHPSSWGNGHSEWCASQYFPADPNDFSTWGLTVVGRTLVLSGDVANSDMRKGTLHTYDAEGNQTKEKIEGGAKTVVIDLKNASDATTSAKQSLATCVPKLCLGTQA